MSRDDLTQRLDELEAAIPEMLTEYVDLDDLLLAIAGEADVIEDDAVAADEARYVANRIDRILAKAGLRD